MTVWGEKVLQAELDSLRSAGNGTRNAQLNRVAYVAAGLAAGNQVEEVDARKRITDTAKATGLGEPEIHATLNSGWTAGLSHPKTPAEAERPSRGEHAIKLNPGQRIVATFEWRKGGRLLYRTHRIEPGEGRKKDFAYDHPDGAGGWKPGRGGDPVPYRVDDWANAPSDAIILMAEGEAKADQLAGSNWDFLATSSKHWSDDFAEYVQDRTFIILPDNDPEGQRIASRTALKIQKAGGTPIILDLKPLLQGGDILDWSGMGHSAFELRQLIDEKLNPPRRNLPLIDIAAWQGLEIPPRVFAWGDWIPIHQTTMLTGDGGVGKSLFAQQMATCAALGFPLLGRPMRQTPALYLTCEDDADELWRRQSAICAALGIPLAGVIGKLHLVSLCGEASTALATFDQAKGALVTTERWKGVEETAAAYKLGFCAFDNATDLFAGDHSNLHEVAAFVQLITGLAIRQDGVSAILHHPNKQGDDWLGSIAWHNKVRSRLIMKRSDIPGDLDARNIENPKANYSQAGGRVDFRWFRGAYLRDEDLPPNMAEEMAKNAQANHDNDIFLRCLAERKQQLRAVSEKSGPNFAPAIFAKMPESKGIGKARLDAAMDRLFSRKVIERGFLWRDTAEGRDIHGLRETSANASANDPQTRSANDRDPQPQTTVNTHPIPKGISGAAPEAAAPSGYEEGLQQ